MVTCGKLGNTWLALWKRWGSTVQWCTKSSHENLANDGRDNLSQNMGAQEPGGSGRKTGMKEKVEGLFFLLVMLEGQGDHWNKRKLAGQKQSDPSIAVHDAR